MDFHESEQPDEGWRLAKSQPQTGGSVPAGTTTAPQHSRKSTPHK